MGPGALRGGCRKLLKNRLDRCICVLLISKLCLMNFMTFSLHSIEQIEKPCRMVSGDAESMGLTFELLL